MPKMIYFPLFMDRWLAGTRQMTFEQKGFYLELLIWMYQTGEGVKNAEHAARIVGCDPRTSRRLLADLRPKFYERSGELRHKLVTELIKKGGRIKHLVDEEKLRKTHTVPVPDPEYIYINKLDTKIAKNVPTKTNGSGRDWQKEIATMAANKGLQARPGESWQEFSVRVKGGRTA